MRFFGTPWPQHHGIDLRVILDKQLLATSDEMQQGIRSVQVVQLACQDPDCRRTDFWYLRYEYRGGWGPINRIRNQAAVTTFKKRLRLAPPSDLVIRSHPMTGWPQLVPVL